MDELKINQSPTDDNVQPLFEGLLLKSFELTEGGEDKPWSFAGIASDESEDVEGDRILRKSIDLTYANQRGYVNWDHSREPADQIGYLTKATIVPPSQVKELRKAFPQISDSASVYIEGELYKHVPKAVEVFNIMKSCPEGTPGLGISLDGSVARDAKSGGVVKAYVRGVALTAQPVQTRTLLKLNKSLQLYNQLNETVGLPSDITSSIASEVVTQLQALQKSVPGGMSVDEAVLFVLKQRPNWNYEVASKVVQYTIANKAKG